ncbi:kelch-like protein 9 isoform X2 [Esox lucius]|uniref:kelch-like protein 9 isoform X2 n=1 Tax=Esox lucius TaxID=8010 RepID=UPI001476ED23|nr:kelch-like protein 9 isoform X2 [Esox lucius]
MSLLRNLSLRGSRKSSNKPTEMWGSGEEKESGQGRLHRRLSRLGSRSSLREPPRPPPQPVQPPPPVQLPVPAPVPVSAPVPAPTLAPAERPISPPQKPPTHQIPVPKPLALPPRIPENSLKPSLPPKPLTRVFSSNKHGSAVLQGFEMFRIDETLCDVILVPGDSTDTFPVHRVIMASASDYFKAMFTGGMREQEMKTIKLHAVSKTGLKNIIDFIYTSRLRLSMADLQDTLEAANFLQVLPVLGFCNDLLSTEITVDNCLEVEHIAGELLLEDVQAHIVQFVCQNLSALLQSGRYLQLSESSMSNALASDSLKGFTEMELYRVARSWIDHEPSTRLPAAHSLMRHVRFPLMTPTELLQISQEDEEREDSGGALMRSNTACVNLLLEASNYQMMPFLQPSLQTERTRIRSDATHLLALGGVMRQQLVVSRELRLYDEDSGHWRALKPMEVPRYQHGVALVGGFLYIVGGQSTYDTKGKTAVDSAYRYDPRFDQWLQVASLNEKRTFFHLSALKGRLYAVGGRNTSGEIDTVECYNLRKNEWTFVAPMIEPHYGHAGTVHGELMYVSGGITKDTFQKGLLCYDPDTDTWSRRADMMELRGLHCMCTVGDRLYVMGGNHFRGSSDYDDVLTCEFYSPEANQWTAVAAMPRGQSDVGVAVFKGQIYVVGGYSWNSRCMVDIVQRYDPEKDEWDRVFNVLEPLGGIRACTMTVHLPEGSVDDGQMQDYPLDTVKS